MTKSIITISRQYGSGGREIGARVAEHLGFAYYDKELIRRMALAGDMDEDLASSGGEGLMGKVSTLLLSRGGEGSDQHSLPLCDRMFLAQAQAIKQIASEGPCVIVGHCADYFLADCPGTLNIFIYAEGEARVQRVMARNGLDRHAAAARIKKTDKKRATFYEQYTERKWGCVSNYDLCCSSSSFGIDGVVDLIVGIALLP
ncbi:MAG: cytidylate kinase-like family protein [Coriobacteriales bacterium]|jgi:cytidylate kinase|nr:cytidylate kinase-like family protein [Coriobacteriales bacterium]